MEKVRDINEAVAYLNEGEIITTNGKDQFVMKNKKVHRYCDGTSFALDIKSFAELYRSNTFYLYEEAVEIDDKKDEEYYRYYKK